MEYRAQSPLGRSLLSRFFPTPAFLRMSSVGVDVSDKSIKYLRLKDENGKCRVDTYGDVGLADGAVVGGDIKDEHKLIAGLREVRAKAGTAFARASLPEQKAYFFTTSVSGEATHDQIVKILEFELEEHVPLSPTEAVVDYDRIEGKKGAEGGTIRIGVTVYPRKTIDRYTHVFVEAGFFPLSFEIEAQAIERAVLPRGERGAFMIIDLGETRTGISIVHNGTLSFTSTLDVAGSDLTTIFMKELSIPREKIAHVKNTIGLMGGAKYTSLTQKLEESLGALGTEIKRHFDYWETHATKDTAERESIEEVILCGGNANVKGLSGYLEQMLKVPVRRANVWVNVLSLGDETPVISYEHSFSYSTAIGLALRNDN